MKKIVCGLLGVWLACAAAPALAVTLGHLTVTDRIDKTTRRPEKPVAVFGTGAKVVWAAAEIRGAPAGTRVGVQWVLQKGGDAKVINRTAIKARGTRYVAFKLTTKGGRHFPPGVYTVHFLLNRKPAGSVSFTVGKPGPAAGGYAGFVDPAGRFRVELPRGWAAIQSVRDPHTVVQVRWRGADDSLALVVIKVYDLPQDKHVNAVSAVTAMRDALLKEGEELGARVSHSGALAPEDPQLYVWALGFLYKDKAGRELDDRKQIYGIGDHLFVFNFIAETSIYNRVSPVFAHVLKSFGPAPSS
jgi:hypothetical protein